MTFSSFVWRDPNHNSNRWPRQGENHRPRCCRFHVRWHEPSKMEGCKRCRFRDFLDPREHVLRTMWMFLVLYVCIYMFMSVYVYTHIYIYMRNLGWKNHCLLEIGITHDFFPRWSAWFVIERNLHLCHSIFILLVLRGSGYLVTWLYVGL